MENRIQKLVVRDRSSSLVFITVAIMFVLAMLVFVGNGGANDITGRWRSIDVPGAHWACPTQIEFNRNGTGVLIRSLPTGTVTQAINYTAENNRLTVRLVSTNEPMSLTNPMLPEADTLANIHDYKVVGQTLSISPDDSSNVNFVLDRITGAS